jgi:hypothetical protein
LGLVKQALMCLWLQNECNTLKCASQTKDVKNLVKTIFRKSAVNAQMYFTYINILAGFVNPYYKKK